MPTISERDLSVFISLLSVKIRELTSELQAASAVVGEPTDQQIDEQIALQETLDQYVQMRETMREEYELGLQQGLDLPSYEMLICAPGS